MNNSEITYTLQEVFRKVFENPQLIITETTKAEDIAMWDSLTHMELVAEVESAFSIQFSLNEVINFNTVGDMIKVIQQKKQ